MSLRDTETSLLLKAATPALYRGNAFRLTGLPVTATAREIAMRADKLKRLAEVGGQAALQLTIVKNEEPPKLEDVREAAQKLKNVEARALDEFFWFWPETWERPGDDEACQKLKDNDLDAAFAIWHQRRKDDGSVVSLHNLALLYHMRALEWAQVDLASPVARDDKKNEYAMWKYSLDLWEALGTDEGFWGVFDARIRQVNDAALTDSFARRIRAELPQAFDRINAELALAYAARGRREEAKWHVIFLKSTHEGSDNLTATLDAMLYPARDRLSRLIETAEKATAQKKQDGLYEAAKLLDEAQYLLALFELFHDEVSLERGHLFDKVASAAFMCAMSAYNAAISDSNAASALSTGKSTPLTSVTAEFISVLERAKTLATDIALRTRIDENIATAQGNQRAEATNPIMSALADAQKNEGAPPQQRLEQLKRTVLPKVDTLLRKGVLQPVESDNLCNAVAIVLRGLGIEAANKHAQFTMAWEALELAAKYAKSADLVTRLKQDMDALRPILQATGQPFPVPAGAKPMGFLAGCVVCIGLIGVLGGVIAVLTTFLNSSNPPPAPTQQKSSTPRSNQAPKLVKIEPPPTPSETPRPVPAQPVPLPPPPAPKPNDDAPMSHIWTDPEGNTKQGVMLDFDGTFVVLKTSDGRITSYLFRNLSAESQNLAWKLKPDANASKNVQPFWTHSDGRSTQARMLSFDGETVMLQVGDSRPLPIPIGKLSAESQAMARRGGR